MNNPTKTCARLTPHDLASRSNTIRSKWGCYWDFKLAGNKVCAEKAKHEAIQLCKEYRDEHLDELEKYGELNAKRHTL